MTAVVCVASGPSLTTEQTALVASARAAGKCRVIVVNDNWRLLPNADELYASDAKWWKRYIDEVREGFRGECWTQDRKTAETLGVCYIEGKPLPGLSLDPGVIHTGQNSGYAAVGRAFHRGGNPIILVGYDMQREGGTKRGKAHWFGDHPAGMGNASNPAGWVPNFTRLAIDLEREGAPIVNCSIATALQLPRADLAETLAAL